MNPKLNQYTDEESIKYNGQTVSSVLTHLGDAATAEKICEEIAYLSKQSIAVVEPEVKRILRRGISNGFLVKFGKNYLLSGAGSPEVDSKRKSYMNIGGRVNQRKSNVKSVEKITEIDDPFEYESVNRNISLKLDQTDGDQFVLLKPREAVNAIIHDLYKMVQTSDETSDDDVEIIDLEAVISRNLNAVSKPYNNA